MTHMALDPCYRGGTMSKPDAIPESVRDRLSGRAHGSVDKSHAAQGIWPPLDQLPCCPVGRDLQRTGTRHTAAHVLGRIPDDVRSLPPSPTHLSHTVAFPVDLLLRRISTGCRPGGTVPGSLSGSGPAALEACELVGEVVLVDTCEDYHRMAPSQLTASRQQK
ncbi:hypothetical protein [Streptomyces noursei]|uniref:hypothetical protein n=1 Tax=Streptomyces noursei TaxID=1971 RepID=UPI00380C91CB